MMNGWAALTCIVSSIVSAVVVLFLFGDDSIVDIIKAIQRRDE